MATSMLKILVIDESRLRAGEICAGLALAGHQVVAVLASAANLADEVEQIRPDVILIDTEAPSRDTLEHLAAMHRDMPRPVVIFAQESDDATIRKAIGAGVAAYVVDGLDAGRLKPVIDVAVARFEAHQALRQELASARRPPSPPCGGWRWTAASRSGRRRKMSSTWPGCCSRSRAAFS